jgi:hypothetical protein
MPWTPQQATAHQKRATTSKLKRMWRDVANRVLADTHDEGRAIREASAAVDRELARGPRSAKRKVGR